jgi:microcystin-dependent protein
MPTTTPRLALPYPTPDDTADVPRDIQALANALDSLVYIIGELRTFALAAAPAKWLASGSAVAQTDYPELYAALQNTWNIGGEAAGTFRAGPVVAGRTIVGAGQGPGLTNRAVAARFGVESVGLAAAQNGPHAHTGRTLAGSTDSVGNHQHNSSVDLPTQILSNGNGGVQQYNLAAGFDSLLAFINNAVTSANGAHAHTIPAVGITVDQQGAGTPHENMSPSVAALICIYAGR